MTARAWKRTGAGLAAALLAVAGWVLWRNRREAAERAVLIAEIEAERAARKPRPAWPVPTEAESETADQYFLAISKLHLDDYYGDFSTEMEKAPWSAVPEPVGEMLAANTEALSLVDAAAARAACRFADAALQSKGGCMKLLSLLLARGHAALARGNPVAAAEDVRRLLRVGRDLAAAPSPGGEDAWPWPDFLLIRAEEHASGLLSALASAPGLPPEAGPALAAAARDPWESPAAFRRDIDWHEDNGDAILLRMLGPDAGAWLDRENAKIAELQEKTAELQRLSSGGFPTGERSLLEKFEDRARRALRPGIEIPKAADARAFRALQAPIVAALRRRDIQALAPGGDLDRSGKGLGMLSPSWFRHSLADGARIAVARAAAAVRAFQLREGRPPRALEEVVPSVLPEVPIDPFDGKPLLYEVDGDGWRVASRVWQDRFGPGAGEDYPPAEVRFPRPAK
jgi:hypothetical protein